MDRHSSSNYHYHYDYHYNNEKEKEKERDWNNLPKTINPKLLQPSLFPPETSYTSTRSQDSDSNSDSLRQQQQQTIGNPFSLDKIDSLTYSRIHTYPSHPLYIPQQEFNSVWLSDDWRLLPFHPSSNNSTSASTIDLPDHHHNHHQEVRLDDHSRDSPIYHSHRPSITFPSLLYTNPNPTTSTGSLATPFPQYHNQYSPHSIPYFPSPLPYHNQYQIFPPSTIMSGTSSTSNDINRSRIFPFPRINLENQFDHHNHLQYHISSERDQQSNISIDISNSNLGFNQSTSLQDGVSSIEAFSSNNTVMDMGCQGQQYPLGPPINLITSGYGNPFWQPQPQTYPIHDTYHSHSATSTSISISSSESTIENPLQPGLNLEQDTDTDSEDEDEDEDEDEFRPIENENANANEDGSIVSIELSSSTSSSLSCSGSKSKSTTTVLSLEEISDHTISPYKNNVISEFGDIHDGDEDDEDEYQPMDSQGQSSSSSPCQAMEGDYIEYPQSPITRNGRYPTRLNTIKPSDRVNRDKHKGKGIKSKGKNGPIGKGITKPVKDQRKTITGSSNSSYENYKATSNGNGNGMVNGEKVPTGPFLFQLMKMLAYDKYPGYVILKNQVAYIPDTEAFAANVYADKDKGKGGSNQWTSFQRNLNNYSKYWPFKRRAVEGTNLSSQRIEIPTIAQLKRKWIEYGFDIQQFQKEKKDLEDWVKSTVPIQPLDLKSLGKRGTYIPDLIFQRQTSENNDGNPNGKSLMIRIKPRLDLQDRDVNKKVKVHDEEGSVDELDVEELYSEEETTPNQLNQSNETQPSNDEIKIPPLNSPKVDPISSQEKIQLRLRIDGTQLTPTPEKVKDNKRKFATLCSELSNEGEEQEIDYPEDLFTPSPTLSSLALITPQTSNFTPMRPTTTFWRGNNEGQYQCPTPVSLPKPHSENLENPKGGSSRPVSSGNDLENDVFGPVLQRTSN